MLKDASDDYVRDSLLSAQPASSRKRGLLKTLSGLLAIGFVATVLYQLQSDQLETPGPEPLSLAGGVTFDVAVDQSARLGYFYTLSTRKWPDNNVFMDAAAGWLYCYGGK